MLHNDNKMRRTFRIAVDNLLKVDKEFKPHQCVRNMWQILLIDIFVVIIIESIQVLIHSNINKLFMLMYANSGQLFINELYNSWN